MVCSPSFPLGGRWRGVSRDGWGVNIPLAKEIRTRYGFGGIFFANISLKMLGIHKVFLRFLPHLGRKSDCQNCLHLKMPRFACSRVFLRRRNTVVFQGEKRPNVREDRFLRHIVFETLLLQECLRHSSIWNNLNRAGGCFLFIRASKIRLLIDWKSMMCEGLGGSAHNKHFAKPI